ncbi:MAG: WXG100 family type VII secretion target [Anaerolineae bacterium]|jgi:WXG100 family type VII secretion target|nr:WXG100 family type VII secretion target [Anaerolineae bacterium]
MTKVQIYYDEMDVLIQRVNDMAAQMVDRQSLLRNHAEGLADGGWIGGGADAFYDEFFNLILPSLSKLERALEATAGGFRRASDMLREAENEGRNLFGRGDSTGGGSSTGGGNTGGGSTTPMTQREQVLQRLREAIATRQASLTDILGIINNGFGGTTGLANLPGKWGTAAEIIGILLQTAETGSEGEGFAGTIEKLFEGGTQGLVEFGLGRAFPPVGIALAVSDLVQVGGTFASGFSSFVHDVNPDPDLANSIRNFNTTLENADLGSITGSFASVVVDLGQMGVSGFTSDSPFLNALSMSGIPGAPIIAGAIENPALLQELGHNGLTFVGSVVDFGIGAAMLPGAAVDMGADTVRVGTHAVGQFFNLPPEIINTISSTLGDTVQFVGDTSLSVLSPVGALLNQLPDFDAPDVSGWLGSLIPSP